MFLTRRQAFQRALSASALAAGAAAFATPPRAQTPAPPRFVSDPFALGVASGDPSVDGFVIWTRLAPDPLNPDGLGGDAYEVQWRVARDEGFRDVVRRGRVQASPERAHTVHVELAGLEPDRPYWYRFEVGEARSPVGRAFTLPAYMSRQERLKLAWVSCQHYEQGWFNSYRDLVAWDPRLVLHLGDYIYESSWGPQTRRHPANDAVSLEHYRAQHAAYKLDRDMQAAHAHTSWGFIWDDHEVDNDYTAAGPENPADAEGFAARRAAAHQAYFEHMPIARRSLPVNGQMRLHQMLNYGDLAQVMMLDTRQHRAQRACVTPERWRTSVVNCPELNAPERTILGAEQEFWFNSNLRTDRAQWTVIAQPTLFSNYDQKTAAGERGQYSDGWGGYPVARQKIIDSIAERAVKDAVFIGGDMHSFWAADVKQDFLRPASPTVASEFVGTSISTHTDGHASTARRLAEGENSHVKFFDGRVHGYARATIDRRRWDTEFRQVDSVWTRTPVFSTLKRFAVETGRPGVQDA